ncbi:discoidin domain-containing protein [uncultured Bacteroides sp.]|uniref:discoidin domain-containing protein n=1 Tax=uncultured Bacteroides sp. TaxID=162156 RepID=UPI0025DE4D33|nr:discoidin domain-containing protein [uncultured Bacteroides sp.]
MKQLYTRNNVFHLICILCAFFASCSSDNETITVPDNWINISDEAFTIGYEGGSLTRDFTVPEAVNPEHIYIVSESNWVRASIKNSIVNLDITESIVTQERNSTVTLIYDEAHRKEISVTQAAAPAAKVSEIILPASLHNQVIGLGQTFDLNSLVEVLPENAGNKTLNYTAEGDKDAVSIANGILKIEKEGTATIKVAATDGSGVTAELKIICSGTEPFIRNGWSVETSIKYNNGNGYVADGETGKPEDMFDGDPTTFLSLVKPGKTYSGCTTPTGYQLDFVVDMGVEQSFNYFTWGHRGNNSCDYLRVWGISIEGSNNGKDFTEIESDIDIPHANNTDEIKIEIPESTYRYIKVKLVKWSDIAGGSKSGSSMQIGEFNVGKK